MGQRAARLIFLLAAAAVGGGAAAECAPQTVELRNATGAIQRFSVEVADDSQSRARGLMFRESLPLSSGMLFVFPAPKHATFWMKDTPIGLDIIFVDVTGRVLRVHENAVPMSEALIDGGPDVAFALEINAGLARPMGIEPGSVLRHPSIAPDQAAWPCDPP
ncbi:DUF192 domain-containing protein [Tabrizicola sp.]|uniref:DUF192 domain-containing protein n=1 Tax=Tabrizicola sp. TaxID=2005166 RepID=UPI003D28D670